MPAPRPLAGSFAFAGSAVLVLLATGCARGSGEAAAGTTPTVVAKKEPVAVGCPALGEGTRDVAAMFGVDAALAGKLERVIRLGGELEAASSALARDIDAACATLARDLDPAPLPATPSSCRVAAERLETFRARLARAGGKLSLAVSDVRCTLPKDAVALCAGECLTGERGVVGRVDCRAASAGAACDGDFTLPNAPPACVSQCRARALSAVRCAAEITVTVDGADEGEDAAALAATAAKLREDLPRIVGYATDVASLAAQVTRDVPALVDEVGGAIDAMTSAPANDRRLAIGAVLATCFAPPLARTVEASVALAATVDDAKQLAAALPR